MRHLVSLGAGLLLAPVIWFLAALGDYRLLAALPRGAAGGGSSKELLLGVLLLLACGLWLGVLLGTRISPLGPVAAALAWLGLGALFISDPATVAGFLPDGPNGQVELFTLPLEHGYAYLVGAAMLVPAISAGRWRGTEAPRETEEPLSPYAEPTAVARADASHLQPLRDEPPKSEPAKDEPWPPRLDTRTRSRQPAESRRDR
jgi:hypothetical protein